MRKVIATLAATAALTAVAGVCATAEASATSNRKVCAESVTIRSNDGGTNIPVGYLYKGDTFIFDHYSPSGEWAVGVGVEVDGHQVPGYVEHNTITDASGHCQPPYN